MNGSMLDFRVSRACHLETIRKCEVRARKARAAAARLGHTKESFQSCGKKPLQRGQGILGTDRAGPFAAHVPLSQLLHKCKSSILFKFTTGPQTLTGTLRSRKPFFRKPSHPTGGMSGRAGQCTGRFAMQNPAVQLACSQSLSGPSLPG